MLDLSSRQVAYRVDLDADMLQDGAARDSKLSNFGTWNTEKYRAIHPLALWDSDLIFKDHWSPLLRNNACGTLVWRLENDGYNYTTEVDNDGTLLLATSVEPTRIKRLRADFFDDAIVQVSSDGEDLYERSLTQVITDAGLGNLLFSNSRFSVDPMHLNDVQPVPRDGPYWRAGDVFLSIRHLSMIILFRPGTDEIIWMKQGPWAAQHDVEIIEDHTIAVFNNMFNLGKGEFVDGTSEILGYDFATDTSSSPYQDIFEKYQIRTEFAGLFSLLPSGHLLIEDSSAGRFLIFAPGATLVAENVNRAQDGLIYHQGWSRFVDRARGDAIVNAMRAQDCYGRDSIKSTIGWLRRLQLQTGSFLQACRIAWRCACSP